MAVSEEVTRVQALPSPPRSSALRVKNRGVCSRTAAGAYGAVPAGEYCVCATWRPVFLGGKKSRYNCRSQGVRRDGLVTLQVSGARRGNSRSLLTNADDAQGVNEKYRGKTLCF